MVHMYSVNELCNLTMKESVEVDEVIQDSIRYISTAFGVPCWLRIAQNDDDNPANYPNNSEKQHALKRLQQISLQQMVGFRQGEFDWALKRVGVLTEKGSYCKQGAEDFFRCCGIGTNGIAQAGPFAEQHKCKKRWWARLGPQEILHDNIMRQLNSEDAMPPRCNFIHSIRRELKEKVWRCMDNEDLTREDESDSDKQDGEPEARQRLTNNKKEYKTNESKE